MVRIDAIEIRSHIVTGDLGYVIHLHGLIYGREFGYGVSFEAYVAAGLLEFYQNFDPARDRVWICEHDRKTVGFLLLMHRGNDAAQLRYFLIDPAYRGIGLGKTLLRLWMEFFHEAGYKSAYLWTTHELSTAAALYRKHGFVLTETKDSTVFGKPLKEQRYDLVLTR